MLKFLGLGFVINLFTSIDDALTRIPVLSAVTKTRMGRIAFSLGNLLAVTVAVTIAVVLSSFLQDLPNVNVFVAILLFGLATVVYFDLIKINPPKHVQKHIEAPHHISKLRFFKLLGLGFVMTFFTMIDDILALAPLFLGSMTQTIYSIAGIYLAAIVLIIIVIYFAEKIAKFKYNREVATAVLIGFGLLLLFGLI